MINHKLPAFTLTISNAVLDLAAAIADAASDDQYALPEGANRVEVQVKTNDLNYLWDGNDPTLTTGVLVNAGNSFAINGDIGKLKMIRNGTGDVTITVQVKTMYPGEY